MALAKLKASKMKGSLFDIISRFLRDSTSNSIPSGCRLPCNAYFSQLSNSTSLSFLRIPKVLSSFSSHNTTLNSSEHGHATFSLRDDGIQVADSRSVDQNIESKDTKALEEKSSASVQEDQFPSEDMTYKAVEGWNKFIMCVKILIALPWKRIKKGSVLKMKLSGKITEQLPSQFSQGLSLPQVCENLIKATYDPRISAVYLQIEPLSIGWGKIDEIRRHIYFYRKSGKLIIGYMPVGGEKEFYLACACEKLYAPPGAYITLFGLKVQAAFIGGVLRKIGVEPKIQRIGKYKSFGDTLSCDNMSEANREMLSSLLDDIFDNWIEQIAASTGKQKNDVEGLLEEGIFEVEKLKQDGWITDIKYLDEIDELLKKRLNVKAGKWIPYVDFKKYAKVSPWTLNLSGGKEQIAVLRAVGNITRAPGGVSNLKEAIVSDQLIAKIRQARESKKFKAVILRIDSAGGDALASDLTITRVATTSGSPPGYQANNWAEMVKVRRVGKYLGRQFTGIWRELRLLAFKKPLVVSMVDVAASGGYYMAMGADVIVSEKLTLTGSIGVVAGKVKLSGLYEKIGFRKEVISRGKFAELEAEQRPFRPDEEDIFAKIAQDAYKRFRDKAALSRSMEVDKMESVAQGRVWTGKAAKGHGLVDSIGGFSKAIAIAKKKAGISQETKVSLVEMSKRTPSLSDVISANLGAFSALYHMLSAETGIHGIIKRELLDDGFSPKVQYQMDDIFSQNGYQGSSTSYQLLNILQDCFSFLKQ